MKNENKQPELDLVDLAIKSGKIVITPIKEKDNENFLRQLKSARFMYNMFINCSEINKNAVAKETLESLIVLQQMLSKAIVNVYNVYDKQKE